MTDSARLSRNGRDVLPDLFPGWKNDWTDWYTVMNASGGEGFKKRVSTVGELVGYKVSRKSLEKWFGRYDNGIYEWRTTGLRGGNATVVYVGKTSSKDPMSLVQRIKHYTTYQSHERKNINDTLEAGLQLQVRALSCGRTGSTAENMEKRALKAFSYSWNDVMQ